MLTDTALRLQVKSLKIYNNISYKSLSEELGIKPKSFYSWMKGDFDLSSANKIRLEQIIDNHKE